MRTDIDIQIIERVKALRKERDISQRTLAEMLGVSYGFIGDVEKPNSHHKYSAYHIYKIAKQFGCDFHDIFPPINRIEP